MILYSFHMRRDDRRQRGRVGKEDTDNMTVKRIFFWGGNSCIQYASRSGLFIHSCQQTRSPADVGVGTALLRVGRDFPAATYCNNVANPAIARFKRPR